VSVEDRGTDPRIARLVAAAQGGDVDAFCELYRVFAPRVYRFCRFRVVRPVDAEDLVQETFERAIEALPRYEDRGLPFAAWLFRIARNLVIDFERSRRDDLDLDDLVRSRGEAGGADGLDGAIERDALLQGMAGLTVDQREVIAYRFFADLTARETGRLMNRHEATVRALQSRAIAALRRRLLASALTERSSATPGYETPAVGLGVGAGART
jgi:RNA polymerase sigma-70 factor (ECF subfamily)